MKSGAEGAHFFGALLLTFSFDKHIARNMAIKFQKKIIKATHSSISLNDDTFYLETPVVEYDFIEESVKNKFSEDELIQLVSETLSDAEKIWSQDFFLEPKDISVLAKEQNISIGAVYKRKRVLRTKLESSIKKVLMNIENEMYCTYKT